MLGGSLLYPFCSFPLFSCPSSSEILFSSFAFSGLYNKHFCVHDNWECTDRENWFSSSFFVFSHSLARFSSSSVSRICALVWVCGFPFSPIISEIAWCRLHWEFSFVFIQLLPKKKSEQKSAEKHLDILTFWTEKSAICLRLPQFTVFTFSHFIDEGKKRKTKFLKNKIFRKNAKSRDWEKKERNKQQRVRQLWRI